MSDRKLGAPPTFGRSMTVFMLVFVAYMVAKWDWLESPPYWDAAFGVWTEASFLADTNFNYFRLRFQEAHATSGGAYAYLISVIPTILAALMKLGATTPDLLLGYHLFNLACASAVVTMVWWVAAPRMGSFFAALVAGLLAVTPVFTAQAEQASLEMPLVAAALAAFLSASRRGDRSAAALATLAFFIKPTGLLVTLTLLCWRLTERLLLGRSPVAARNRRRRREIIHYGSCVAAQVAVLLASGIMADRVDPANRDSAAGLFALWFWCPDVVVIAIIVVMGWSFLLLGTLARVRPRSARSRIRTGLAAALRAEPLVFLTICLLFLDLLAAKGTVVLPRYLLVAMPLVYLALGILLIEKLSLTAVIPAAVLVAAIGFQIANSHGRFLTPIEKALSPAYARTGALLERSLEYRSDHLTHQAVAKAIVAEAESGPIFAGHPFAYYLALPRLGYVEKAVPGYALNAFSESYPGFPNIADAPFLDLPPQPIFVKLANSYHQRAIRFAIPDPESNDDILCREGGDSPIVVFRKRWGGYEPAREAREQWFLDRTYPWSATARARCNGRYFMMRKDFDRAIEEIWAGLEDAMPTADGLPDKALANDLAQLLVTLDRYPTAIMAKLSAHRRPVGQPWPELTVPRSPQLAEAESLANAAVGELLADRFESSFELFTQALAANPNQKIADYVVGYLAFQEGRLEEARRWLEPIAAAGSAPADRLLGLIALQRGDVDRAMTSLERSVNQEPRAAEGRTYLGLAYAKAGLRREATTELLMGLSLRPRSTITATYLAKVRSRSSLTSAAPTRVGHEP